MTTRNTAERDTRSTSKDDRIRKINDAISALVYDKLAVKKAYNYYHGILDMDQFKHLEEAYGIGTPTQIKFYPLVKKHVDALVGKFLELPLNIQIACKDKTTLSNIFRERQLQILESTRQEYMKDLYTRVLEKFGNVNNPIPKDPITEEFISQLHADINKNFISEYEVAAQNIIKYISQSRSVDMENKVRMLLTDLLISGTLYFRTKPCASEENVDIEALNPIDTFVEKNYNSYYLKDCPRAVCRFKRTLDQILLHYGNELSEKDKKELMEDMGRASTKDGQTYVMRSTGPVNAVSASDSDLAKGILGGLEVTPVFNDNEAASTTSQRWIYCYEVEYIEADKDGTQHRYSGVRIGEDIYILRPKDLNVVRSKDNAKKCTLSINGLFLTTRQNHPFSLVLATANLQDLYNILFFHRENLIAVGGTKGAWVDFSQIPVWLDEDETTRLLKWQAYRKQGLGLMDSSQNEPGSPPLNTIYNGFDDTVSLSAIQAIDLSIERVEQAASNITGVFREMIGGIEEKDAVHNVKVGIDQSLIVVKLYFANMKLALKELILDSLDVAKVVYKKGLTGALILGEKAVKIFTALPEHFTLSDYDINIADGQEAVRDLEEIKAANMELIKAGQIDAKIAVETIGCKSLTEYKNKTLQAIKAAKEENSQIQQIVGQVQQYEQALKEAQQQIQALQQQNQNLQQKLAKEEGNSEKLKIEWYKAQEENERKKEKNEIDNNRVRLEELQMFDNNPRNNEVKY